MKVMAAELCRDEKREKSSMDLPELEVKLAVLELLARVQRSCTATTGPARTAGRTGTSTQGMPGSRRCAAPTVGGAARWSSRWPRCPATASRCSPGNPDRVARSGPTFQHWNRIGFGSSNMTAGTGPLAVTTGLIVSGLGSTFPTLERRLRSPQPWGGESSAEVLGPLAIPLQHPG